MKWQVHVEIGIRILEKYGVDNQVILAMRAHHEEYPYETPESIIVQVADAISGGRPGPDVIQLRIILNA